MIAAIVTSAIMQWNLQIGTTNTLHFTTIYRSHDTGSDDGQTNGRTYPLSALGTTFKGLSIQQLRTPGTALRFEIVHQEGTLTFTGHSLSNAATGDFTYALDPSFAANLEKRGTGRPTERMQFEWLIAGADVYALLDAVSAAGFPTPNVTEIKKAVDHDVTADYLRGLASTGMHPASLEKTITAVDHDVTPQGIRSMQAYGFHALTLDQAITLVDHDVTPKYLDGLSKLGYHVTPDQAVRMVDHDVTIAYIEQLRTKGYSNLSVNDLIRLADHDVH